MSHNQAEAILAHLRSGRTLTPLQALDLYGCNRLAARIHDLKKAGYPIERTMEPLPNGKTVARYRLPQRLEQLTFA